MITGGSSNMFSDIMMIISPIIIVFSVSPVVVLMDYKQKSLKEKAIQKLRKLGLYKKIEVNVNLKPIDN